MTALDCGLPTPEGATADASDRPADIDACSTCAGRGEGQVGVEHDTGQPITQTCPTCHGTGDHQP